MKAPGVLIISQNGQVVVNDLAVFLCPTLNKLKSNELIYIARVYDSVGSPYRLRPIEDRRRIAAAKCWPDSPEYIPEENEKIAAAIMEFQGCVFNHNYHIRDKLLTKLIRLEEQLTAETTAQKIKGIMETMELVSKKIDELNDKILQKESELELRGGGDLTFIEQWQINQEEFKKRTQLL